MNRRSRPFPARRTVECARCAQPIIAVYHLARYGPTGLAHADCENPEITPRTPKETR